MQPLLPQNYTVGLRRAEKRRRGRRFLFLRNHSEITVKTKVNEKKAKKILKSC